MCEHTNLVNNRCVVKEKLHQYVCSHTLWEVMCGTFRGAGDSRWTASREPVGSLAMVRKIPYHRGMAAIESIAKLTSKGQTTVPVAVRKALAVGPDDRIAFTVLDGGRVEVRKVEEAEGDSVVRRYLAFLAEDMIAHPQKLSVIQRDDTIRELLEGVETERFDLSS